MNFYNNEFIFERILSLSFALHGLADSRPLNPILRFSTLQPIIR